MTFSISTTAEQAAALEPATKLRRMSRVRRIVTVATAVAAFVTLTMQASPAHAWVYAGTAGRPGGVTIPQVSMADMQVQTSYGPVTTFTLMSDTGPTVGRSPATSGAQDVLAIYYVQWSSGGPWETVANPVVTARIPSGSASVRLPAVYIHPNSPKGYYRMAFGFTWNVAGTSTSLGTSFVMPDRTSDHRCITPYRRCAVYAGYARVGGIYGNGGW
jgi:hypothetical protein